jgi:teichoic acid transport system ATP-binding protein
MRAENVNITKMQKGEKNTPIIKAKNLGVYYESDKHKRDDFKSHVHGLFQGRERTAKFWALQDISFKGYAGDLLGVIGSNGAGKTTLCRVIAGLLRPNRGLITIQGKVTSLLSLGAGFNKELTGNENIYLNGMMMGLSKKRLLEILPSIQEFSGLGNFLEQPIKHYSSGMKARLGFSIVSSITAEILVIDEVLGTGDMEFSERAVERVWKLVNTAKMVIVVTHSTEFVEKNCNKAIWIEKGKIKSLGDPAKVVEEYMNFAIGNSMPKKKRIVSNLKDIKIEAGYNKSIEVKNLGVKFYIDSKPFWALSDISFTIYDKEIVGIIGPNGAGKTTLCRVLCKIYQKDKGIVNINGELAALLSFGTGFNSQLSGYDNIYLNGMMLGIPKKVIRNLENEIIEFSGLQEFINKPIKQYSKGMKSRLGFSIASMLQPDIFVVDEALTAGDIGFQEIAAAKMQEMMDEAKVVIIVSHNMRIIEKVCTRVLYLNKGKLIFDGDPKEAIEIYKKSVMKK